jgi:hypothetical protein
MDLDEITPTITFVISLWTLAALVAAFTVGMFNRFRKNMATDTRSIVQQENAPMIQKQNEMSNQIAHLSEGLTATSELAIKHEEDLSGKDGLFSRMAHIEGVLSIKRIEPPSTVHDGGKA